MEGLDLPDRPTTSLENLQRYYLTDVGDLAGHDQYLYLHPNGVCCIGVTKQHVLVQAALASRDSNANVGTAAHHTLQVDFGKLASQAPCNGKSRSGDVHMKQGDVLCSVDVGGKQFAVMSVTRRVKLMEVNTRLIERPGLIVDR